jgi:hypothetical protein
MAEQPMHFDFRRQGEIFLYFCTLNTYSLCVSVVYVIIMSPCLHRRTCSHERVIRVTHGEVKEKSYIQDSGVQAI